MLKVKPTPLILLGLLLGSEAHAATQRFEQMREVLGLAPSNARLEEKHQQLEKTLNELVSLGLAQNPSIASSEGRVIEAQARQQSATAAFHPQVNLSSSANRSATKQLNNDLDGKSTTWDAGLNARQNLWRGGQDKNRYEAASLGVEAASLSLEERRLQVTFSIKQAAMLYNQSLLQEKLAAEAEADAHELTSMSERKYNAGVVGRIDVYMAQMRESEATSQLANAKVEVGRTYYSLLQTLGIADQAQAAALDGKLAVLSEAAFPLPESQPSLKQPEIKPFAERTATLESQQLALETSQMRRGRYLPELDFVMGATRTNTKQTQEAMREFGDIFSNTSSDRNQRLSIGLELTWPIWARAKDAQIAETAARKLLADARLHETQLLAKQTTLELQDKIRRLYEALPHYREAYLQAAKLYDAQLRLYDAGTIGIQVVTEAASQRLTSLRNWYNATSDIKLALLNWQSLQSGRISQEFSKSSFTP